MLYAAADEEFELNNMLAKEMERSVSAACREHLDIRK